MVLRSLRGLESSVMGVFEQLWCRFTQRVYESHAGSIRGLLRINVQLVLAEFSVSGLTRAVLNA